jgi:hypothetical protein
MSVFNKSVFIIVFREDIHIESHLEELVVQCPSDNSTQLVVAFVKAIKNQVPTLSNVIIDTMEMLKDRNASLNIYYLRFLFQSGGSFTRRVLEIHKILTDICRQMSALFNHFVMKLQIVKIWDMEEVEF